MAEKEYIEREAVKAWLHEEDFGTPDERWRPESEFGAMVNALPAVDVVPRTEVVRVIEQIEEHIDKGVALVGAQSSYRLSLWFAELKKKYTEGE